MSEIRCFSRLQKRGLLKRSKALTMDMGDRVSHFRGGLMSLPEYESTSLKSELSEEETDEAKPFPSLPDRLLINIGLFGPYNENNKNLNEPDIEEKFARLSLAFKTDKFTLGKRLDLQLRQRDIAEKNIETELKNLRESLNALNQLCTESDMREIITKTQQHVDIVQQATMRMSSRAETYGAIQQEQRMNCAFETMLNYVEHLKLLYDKEHLELEEYRRLLAEHNLLPDEKNSMDEDAKRILPPRSQSLSCSSKPQFLRRGSLGTFTRIPAIENDKIFALENHSGLTSAWNLSSIRQKLECKTRLLSAVCLLNNNYDSPRTISNGNSGSVSPKSRRASLPVGPLAHSSNNVNAPFSNVRAHASINEKHAFNIERKESNAKLSRESHLTRTESEDSTNSKPEADCPFQEPSEKMSEDSSSLKDSSELSYRKSISSDMDKESNAKITHSLQESTCDNELEGDICLLPEIVIPVKSKPLYVLSLIQKASARRIWQWDNATLLMHARYALSAVLVTAAMLTLVLTFVPNPVLAQTMSDSNKLQDKPE
ncbi:inositol 1,4,5-triphosphate receptor associated 1-like isoform X3 [Argiope bruennichi]|uniref:inositol 1,4,5-triphosphate receptor associated 1-like isoform X3 n=1 Tax=Argiope bruennichi TaxID=94029 RepID=UPI0024950575|nr:inositol 1,4,5-triphosphate receptor associated 1-like isoform X3 [Argiope bruennichi]